MKKTHKWIAFAIFFIVGIVSFYLQALIKIENFQILVTFFSIVFGFYITAIAILYNSNYIRELYKKKNSEGSKRNIHILRDYLWISGCWSVISIVILIIFSLLVTNQSNLLSESLIIHSIVLGISSVNIFFMLLLFKHIVAALVLEAKP